MGKDGEQLALVCLKNFNCYFDRKLFRLYVHICSYAEREGEREREREIKREREDRGREAVFFCLAVISTHSTN